jgi:RNA polymerase sigma-70 factor (ECF subfamily)
VIYCVIPSDLAEELHEPLRVFYADTTVQVLVERRAERPPVLDGGGPRSRADRRGKGRLPVDPPRLPAWAKSHAPRLRFVEVEEPSSLPAEDRHTAVLLARFQTGEEAVFDELYRRYFGRVYEYAMRLLRDAHEAENVTHDVFAAALEALGRSGPWDKPLRAWLFATAKNLALMHHRKHGRVEVTEQNELDALADELSLYAEAHGHAALSGGDVWRLTAGLTAFQRQVLELRFKHDLSPEEVADKLGRSRGAIDQAQHRALTTLRSRLI